ncbi:acyl-CoA thioesterase domain-containing protein [Citricoccus sp. I39-566]|uniref:PaaI family thioesterase n=1 Tax=Citricoccus sp. I39-566 TaxID=3073268 RepID=UPI00286D3B07|nr:acyl-CoA thioesterase domain-containing protein [Citricoccus sp. I39-566]WMY79248.1 thioesterase family protein [Citricoccus sp. I39-566]
MTHSTTDAAEATQRSPAQDPRPAPSGRKGISPLGRTERLMRVRIHGVESGAAPAPAGSLTTGPWSYDADGRPTALSAAVLLDNTLAKAVHAAAPDLDWLVTTELQLNVTGPYPADGAELEAWTRASAVDARGGVARGTLLGADGTEYAHATGWFHAVEKNSEQALEHYERQAALPLGPETEAPLSTLLGLHGASPRRDGGRPTVTENFLPGVAFTADDSLRNPHGATHGGALSMMAGLAAQQAMPDRAGYDLQSLQVRFLRPASGAIATRTRVRHAGRALRIVEVELLSGDHGPAAASKPFVQATAAFRAAP